jgi:hypothetical protein
MNTLRSIKLLGLGIVTALTMFACSSLGDGAASSHAADSVGTGQINDECGAGLAPPVFCGPGLVCQAPSYGTPGADGTCQYAEDGGAGQAGQPCVDDTECNPGLTCGADGTCDGEDAGADAGSDAAPPGPDASADDAAPPGADAAAPEPDADPSLLVDAGTDDADGGPDAGPQGP